MFILLTVVWDVASRKSFKQVKTFLPDEVNAFFNFPNLSGRTWPWGSLNF
jgi:hypothetical protein